jgi:hypothetical protein
MWAPIPGLLARPMAVRPCPKPFTPRIFPVPSEIPRDRVPLKILVCADPPFRCGLVRFRLRAAAISGHASRGNGPLTKIKIKTSNDCNRLCDLNSFQARMPKPGLRQVEVLWLLIKKEAQHLQRAHTSRKVTRRHQPFTPVKTVECIGHEIIGGVLVGVLDEAPEGPE